MYAHGNNDYEHYEIIWFDPHIKALSKTVWCEAGVCGELPFENVEAEIEKFDSDRVGYWKSCGVPEEYIRVKVK